MIDWNHLEPVAKACEEEDSGRGKKSTQRWQGVSTGVNRPIAAIAIGT